MPAPSPNAAVASSGEVGTRTSVEFIKVWRALERPGVDPLRS
jgi:hypothetical protein